MYKGDEVITKPSYGEGTREMEGYSAAFCECGYTLYIKTPHFKDWCQIECPRCKHVTNLYCGIIPGYIDEDLPMI